QCCLRHRHRDGDVDIVRRACEHRMRSDTHDEIQITCGATADSSVALARETYSLSITRACLDAELQRLTPREDTFTMTRRAGLLRLAGPAADRALDVELHAAAHLLHLATTVTLRTLLGTTGCALALA